MIETAISTILLITVCMFGVVNPDYIEIDDAICIYYPTPEAWKIGGGFQLNGIIVLPGRASWIHKRHEYGHLIQQLDRRFNRYIAEIAIPSILTMVLAKPDARGNMPWEREADQLGGVH